MEGLCRDCGKPKPALSAERCRPCHFVYRRAGMRPAKGEKTCSMCKKTKLLEDFHRFADAPDGRRAECKECALARRKRFYDAKLRQNYDTGLVKLDCRECGQPFEYVKTTGPRRMYCSERCKHNGSEQIKKNRTAGLPRVCACGSPDVHRVGKPVCPACRKDPRGSESNRQRERRRILRLYNITQDYYDALVARQGNRCAICRTDTPGGRDESWSIDHDHTCCPGKGSCGRCVRGLLCTTCNLNIGYANDDPGRLRAAAAYLEAARQPALFIA